VPVWYSVNWDRGREWPVTRHDSSDCNGKHTQMSVHDTPVAFRVPDIRPDIPR